MARRCDVIGRSTPKRDVRTGHGPDALSARPGAAAAPARKDLEDARAARAIVRLDTSRARALPGVRAVLTGEDSSSDASVRQGPGRLQRGKVRCIRREVGRGGGRDAEIAEEALTLIDAGLRAAAGVFDPLARSSRARPVVHEELATNSILSATGSFTRRRSRVCRGARWSRTPTA